MILVKLVKLMLELRRSLGSDILCNAVVDALNSNAYSILLLFASKVEVRPSNFSVSISITEVAKLSKTIKTGSSRLVKGISAITDSIDARILFQKGYA